eukprot:CAMPEP_0169159262 /NCGR_PEP_ID=MMETSP1015-20121227/55687_1 /TAXON_ID=342587 /ORGANISM="Karlodinium micrum, Strain CCMP2283" /LENGTH=34 /DNA_ID= /DNA_START= /DNA_END= /DNA_ORIENTATION=
MQTEDRCFRNLSVSPATASRIATACRLAVKVPFF